MSFALNNTYMFFWKCKTLFFKVLLATAYWDSVFVYVTSLAFSSCECNCLVCFSYSITQTVTHRFGNIMFPQEWQIMAYWNIGEGKRASGKFKKKRGCKPHLTPTALRLDIRRSVINDWKILNKTMLRKSVYSPKAVPSDLVLWSWYCIYNVLYIKYNAIYI